MALGVPAGEPVERVRGDGERQRPHERRALEMRHELGRADEAISPHAPYERLDAADLARVHPHDRLVVDDDLVPLERRFEVPDDAAVQRWPQHGLFARVPLRRVHLAVGAGDELVGGEAVLREERPADRRIDLDEPTADAVGAPQGGSQPPDECGCLVVPGRAQ